MNYIDELLEMRKEQSPEYWHYLITMYKTLVGKV
jgi:hypothetical protein